MNAIVKIINDLSAMLRAKIGLAEYVQLPRAKALIEHRNAAGQLLHSEISHNVITTAGRDFLHQQGYKETGLGSVGLCYIGLSNDSLTETSASTTLSSEITTNGLARAIGTFAHTAGTNTSTISKTFTATGTQSAQKAALFTAASSGTMNHALSFTQRNLVNGDTLAVTFTITLG